MAFTSSVLAVARKEDDADVPPAVTCPRCRRSDCCGCEPAARREEPAAALPWESGRGSWVQRLWRTAIATSTEPQRAFGELPDAAVGPALAFALLAETLAIGSLAAVLALALWAAAPDLAGRIFSDASVAAWSAIVIAGASGGMVGLHVLWGMCLELGAGSEARLRLGIRFGLYACGWDLLTSPAGIVQGLAVRGVRKAWGPVFAAVRVPRLALRAYLEQRRGFDARARRRGTRLSIAVLGSVIFLVAAAVPLTLLA